MAKPEASPANKGKSYYFMEKKEAVGRGCFERKPIGEK